MGYLDIDNLLGEEERLPCVFTSGGTGMGSLDPTLNSHNLPAKSRVSLPLWLAIGLTEKNIVVIETPIHYGAQMRQEIRAGAESLRLREFSLYFFEVGLRLAQAIKDG